MDEHTMTALAASAAAGASLLDEQFAGWAERIDLSRFDQRWPDPFWGECCVLSQLYGGYTSGLAALFGDPAAAGRALQHGFDIHRGIWDEWGILNERWRAEIRRRLPAPVDA